MQNIFSSLDVTAKGCIFHQMILAGIDLIVMKYNENRMLKSIFSATGIILLSKIVGFIKEILVASYFGTTIETDILSLSQGLISDIKYVLVQVVLTSFVAIYIGIKANDELKAKQFTGRVLLVFMTVAFAVVLVVIIISKPLSVILAPGFSNEQHIVLSHYIRCYAPTLVLFVAISVFNAVLSSNKIFIPGQIEGLLQSSIVIIIVLLFSHEIGIDSLYYSMFVFSVVNFLFMLLLSKKYFSVSIRKFWNDSNIKRMIVMAAPLMIGYSAVYLNQFVDKMLLSTLEAGTVTALGFAASLHNIVASFIVTFASITFPYITDSITEKDLSKTNSLLKSILFLMLCTFLPISIVTVVCSNDIVTVVFARGAFDSSSVSITSLALLGYGFGFLPLIVKEVFSRFLYANVESKLPMRNSLISIGINIILSVILCQIIGVFGVTIATSVSSLICGFLDYCSAFRYGFRFDINTITRRKLLFVIAGFALSCFCSVLLYNHISYFSSFVRLLLTTVTVFLLYFPFAVPLMKSEYKSLHK